MLPDGYDIIGDLHGHATKLEDLLHAMGYRHERGAWRHPSRTAVFVGDLVDRGPEQVQTVTMVRAMVEAGSALCGQGNHELNAIMLATPDGHGSHLRERTPKNLSQSSAFLGEVGLDSRLHREMVDWFMDLPLWLDLPGIRVVHACWDEASMAALAPRLRPGNRLSTEMLADVAGGRNNSIGSDGTRSSSTPQFRAVETLIKGLEAQLPEGMSYRDADGHERTATRTRWWDAEARTYRQAALLPHGEEEGLPELPVPRDAVLGYAGDKPLFIGHYWMTGRPTILTHKVACVDYSAGKGGPLVAYRWSGEAELDDRNFVTTES